MFRSLESLGNFLSGMETWVPRAYSGLPLYLGNFLSGMETHEGIIRVLQ